MAEIHWKDKPPAGVYLLVSPEDWATEEGVPTTSGKSAYEVAVDNGFVGTEAEWLASLQGEDGADSTVPGPPGDSAYEVAVANGFEGTQAQWLASLVGPEGEDSTVPGPSAYDVAVANGFVGTEAEWLESLKGEDGQSAAAQDTGWRYLIEWGTTSNITKGSDAIWGGSGWGRRPYGYAGFVRVRRVGDRVIVQAKGVECKTTQTSDRIWIATAGFAPMMPTAKQDRAVVYSSPSAFKMVPLRNNLSFDQFQQGSGITSGNFVDDLELTYMTADAWPTTLPGVE